MEPLSLESVWLKQNIYEDAECEYQMRLCRNVPDQDDGNSQNCGVSRSLNISYQTHPLLLESINFKQMEYEAAESRYQKKLAGTLKTGPLPGMNSSGSNKGPENYGEKIDSIVKQLDTKHRIWNRIYDSFHKNKNKKIYDIRQSMKKLEEAVSRYSKQMEQDISLFEEHERQGKQFLQTLESTTQTIKELRQVQNLNPKKTVGWKPIYSKLNDIDTQLTTMNSVGLLPNIKEGDSAKLARKTVNNMSLFEVPKNFRKQMGRYPGMTSSLESVDGKLRMHKAPAISKTPTVKKQVGFDDGGLSTESLDGSLGDECLSDSWVSISEIDSEISELNAATGGFKEEGYSVQDGGDAPTMKAQYQMASGVKSKTGTSVSSSPSPYKSNEKTQKKNLIKKKTAGGGHQNKVEVMADAESLDGSLGSEDSSGGNLIACFASLQREVVNGDAKAKSKKQQSNKRKTAPDGKGKTQSSSHNQSFESASNQIRGKNKALPVKSLPKTSDSSCGGAGTSGTSSNKSGKKKKAGEDKSLQQRSRVFVPKTEEVLGGHNFLFQNTKYEYELQLKEMSQRMKEMLFVSGHSFQLQEMFAEAELLLQVLHRNFNEDIFLHRLALLQMAFNFHMQERSKTNQATGFQPEGAKSANPQGSTVKKNTKDRKPAAFKKPIPTLLSTSSRITKIATFDPSDASDRHRAGISSMVVLESIKRLVLVDIINGCLKVFAIGSLQKTGTASLQHSLGLSQPYYMSKFHNNKILVSRAGNNITVIGVSHFKGLEVQQVITCRTQYYGLGWLHEDVVACANYEGNSIDLLRIGSSNTGGKAHVLTSFSTQSQGPELLSILPSFRDIVFLERVKGSCMHATCIDPKSGQCLFSIPLGGGQSDVWNLACSEDKIVCCCKMMNKMILISPAPHSQGRQRVMKKTVLTMPSGAVQMPFAICFKEGKDFVEMYVANDAAWEEDRNHYVTTQVNIFSFTVPSSS